MGIIQINVLTPKNQAQKTLDRQIDALVGYKRKNQIREQKVIKHNEFMIKLEYKDGNELSAVNKRLSRAEIMIKQFYKTLYKFIKKVNRIIRIGNKFGKAGKKGIKYIYKRAAAMLSKEIQDPKQREEMLANLELENVKIENNLFKEIEINDREDMDKLLSKEIIKIKII